MAKFPIDAPIERVTAALERLGFTMLRRGNHIAMQRQNADGTLTPLTIPNHKRLKGSTLRTVLTQARIDRTDFLSAYERS
jgi:predicted RNA binding protein YcfA (HicA-like mRNA interferase family)